MLYEDLTSMERKLGAFPLISSRNKEMNHQITNIVNSINDKFIK